MIGLFNKYRNTIRKKHLCNEFELIKCLKKDAAISSDLRSNAKQRAMDTVREIREQATPGLMEVFLVEYGLSTDEGIALMCLAEALLRVPDNETIDALIEDKIEPSDWGQHLGHSHSTLVNASTWALMLTGKVLEDGDGVSGVLKGAVKRMGEPVIRAAVSRAMKELGAQFVLGQTIEEAIERGQSQMRKGFTYSFDMLGEAAMTAADADDYFQDYARAIQFLAGHAVSDDIRKNPGISIKLSALHPRYEPRQRKRVLSELVGKVLHLAIAAKNARMGLNIDAEESERLEISLDVFEAVLSDPELASWDGFGFVVQAYSKRALPVLEWLYAQAEHFDRKLMVRLVKGAYWDSEVKRAQVEGLNGFPVFTAKANTDVSYLCCANRLGKMTDRIYPQFATHNAHTVSAILEMGIDPELYEFQSLHGMGEALHSILREKHGVGSRIYAPVGAHRDLLAYLVRRLLENGANSSFVNQIINEAIPLDEVAADPFSEISEGSPVVQLPSALYEPERINSKGLDLDNPVDLQILEQAREPFKNHQWQAEPLTATKSTSKKPAVWEVINPADMQDKVGAVTLASDEDTEAAINAAQNWESASAEKRGEILNTAADLYEENFAELFGVITREAGKTQNDCIAELREAVDFLRYYAARAQKLEQPARGIFCCISPWNFPLAIFTGQIAAALAAGNGVIAKPAEATSLTAFVAVNLLHKAGVPRTVLQLLPGEGGKIGRLLTSDRRINGVCFTGSTATAQQINRAMAGSLHPNAPLIAETGGLNAMIVDSTALPEQAVRDIVVSAFQSAGQRCSALRVLYLQEDIAPEFLTMLHGAMDELMLGDPWRIDTDVGPVIDAIARNKIVGHIEKARSEGRVLKQVRQPSHGYFVPPTVLSVGSISELEEEIFGPVLHVALFGAEELDRVIHEVNATGFGLTFGMHSRIDDRVEYVTKNIHCGNVYINRNQIGAIVGSQPFGGEGLSGTGPKAGGPHYLPRFVKPDQTEISQESSNLVDASLVQRHLNGIEAEKRALTRRSLPGPTGESNRHAIYGRGVILCCGPGREVALKQAKTAQQHGCATLCIADGIKDGEGINGCLDTEALTNLDGFDGIISFADASQLLGMRQALACRDGKIIPLICEDDIAERCITERHVCIDTTAAGGNASLLVAAS